VLNHSCLFQMRGIISSHLTGDVGSIKNEKPFKFSVPKKEENGLLSLMKMDIECQVLMLCRQALVTAAGTLQRRS
jgi:hypothetical protein